MNTITLRSTDRAEKPSIVTDAIALLSGLGAEIVDQCQASCEICGQVLDAAA